MREYNLQQDVNWRKILFMVHWNLQRDRRIFEHYLETYGSGLYGEELYWTIKNNLTAYQQLRSFLGVPYSAKLGKELEALLKKCEELGNKEEA